MAKKTISAQEIENQGESKLVMAIYALFAVVGFVVVFSMLKNLLQDYNTSNLIGFIVFSVIFGGLIGYFLGIRNLIYAMRRTALLKSGDFWLVIDEVTDKYHSTNGSDGSYHKDFQLELRKYTAKTNKRLFLRTKKEFDAAKEGDPCILGFTKLSKLPFCVYAGSQYALSPELQSKVVEDMK